IKQVLDKLQECVAAGGTQAGPVSESLRFTGKYCFYLLIVYALGQIVSLCKDYLSLVLQTDYAFHLRDRFARKLFHADYDCHRKKRLGSLINLFENDILTVSSFFQQFLFGVLMNSFHFIGLTVFVFFLNLRLALAGTAVLALHLLIIRFSRKRIESTSRLLRRERIRLSSFVYERLNRIFKIKVLGRENAESDRIFSAGKEFQAQLYRISRFHFLIDHLKEFCGTAGNLITLFVGASFVILGQITWGTLIAFNNYFSKIYQPASVLFNLKLNYHKALVSIRRIGEFLSLPDEAAEDYGKMELPVIEKIDIDDLAFAFDGHQIFSDLSFEIRKGEVIEFSGPNGSGKSTMALLLCGFFRKGITSGRITINGEDFTHFTRRSLRERIAYVPQAPDLFAGTIGELLAASPLGRQQALAVIEELQLSDLVECKGEDFRIEEGGKNLSGGERQRLCLIETLISGEKTRDLIILDEVEAAQDRENTSRIAGLVRALKNSGKTVIIITHRRTEFQNLVDRTLLFGSDISSPHLQYEGPR
ncbi:MAG: ABC transporter ATP-binding protein, partial [Candidatus Wallbacteria bacterium]|nr:ABC transporter ATP-binding protein [Candidatus Wallbacteria bacterium]